ncbi:MULTISPECIES: DUF2589 domain-containing protein [unclassified Streptomyces]|uniref:DUF2589 domain-containing protein n=1 Tax=unclassified Streptomyces TaxID=2593676 RepID=UPI00093AA437|nr:DUF2589 domain-containing protein [Streptomyces sp. TSRI0107]OKJ90679.1 hypothetical protein AMK31_02860 [Streptomyces sp. TSRI0107]
MTRAVEELRQIPFDILIGSPLKAAIEAQGLAAKTTIDFIEKVGFIPPKADEDPFFVDERADADGGTVRNVKFKYTKRDEAGAEDTFEVTVPILSIVPIPYLRIDEMTIDFIAKLTDAVESTVKSNFNLETEAKGTYRAFWSPIRLDFRTAVSYQNSRQTTSRYAREYQMKVNVRAIQDDVPAGLERILDLLEQSIRETPVPP